jgi:tetraacyldisaccharide-1-P 4'-kinase
MRLQNFKRRRVKIVFYPLTRLTLLLTLLLLSALYRSLPPLTPITHTHTTYRPSPIVCPSNVSQGYNGKTALAMAIEMDEYGYARAEIVAVLRAAGAAE